MTEVNGSKAPVKPEVCAQSIELCFINPSMRLQNFCSEFVCIFFLPIFKFSQSHCCKKQGHFKAMAVCWVLGLGSLVAWNSILTIGDYYYNLFPVSGYVQFFFIAQFQLCTLIRLQVRLWLPFSFVH